MDCRLCDVQAKELNSLLKGCSLYLVGIGPKRAMVGRVLSRRLPNYRCYDVGSLMCSTYKAISGSDEDVTLPELMAAEPLADVVQLSDLVMREVQAFKRAIVTVWDGCIKPSDYMIMQQGIVVNLAFSETGDLALPKEDAEATLELWNAGHKKADVTVKLEPNMAADDAAFKVPCFRTCMAEHDMLRICSLITSMWCVADDRDHVEVHQR
jgi:hypothetical protein